MNTHSTSNPNSDNGSELYPEQIRQLFQIGDAFGVDAIVMAAVGFATIGSALGASFLVEIPNADPVTPSFNLVLVGANNRGLPWLDFITSPLLMLAREMITKWSVDRGAALKKLVSGLQQDVEGAVDARQRDDLIAIGKDEVRFQKSGLKPFVVWEDIVPKMLGKLAPQCFDGCMTVLPVARDFFESFMSLRSKDRVELIRMLNLSWKGLSDPVVNLIATGVAPSNTASNAVLGQPNVPPILFLPVTPVQRCLEKLDLTAWRSVISACFSLRRSSATPQEIAVNEAAEQQFAIYARELGNDPWQADLARRIAFLITALEGINVDAQVAIRGVTITRKLVDAHLKLVSAMQPLTPTIDASQQLQERLLSHIRAKQPVTRQELWRSLNDPKAQTFNAAMKNLQARGDIFIEGKVFFAKTSSGGLQ